MEEIIELSAWTFQRLWPSYAGVLYLIKASRDHAEARVQWGELGVATQSTPSPNDCWAIRRHQVYIASARAGIACGHVEFSPEGGYRTICAPLAGQGEVYGWIFLCGQDHQPVVSENALLTATEQLSSALGNLRLRDALKREAIRDPLTGLYNRRYLEEGLEREVARCVRRSLPLTLLVMDLDHFKSFNDNHGHAAGDAVLVAFSDALRRMSRSEDIACRHGGEEFVLVMPESTGQNGLAKAQQIREHTRQLRIQVGATELPSLTVSIGITTMPAEGAPIHLLLQSADEALYRAKRAGRNRVEVAVLKLGA